MDTNEKAMYDSRYSNKKKFGNQNQCIINVKTQNSDLGLKFQNLKSKTKTLH